MASAPLSHRLPSGCEVPTARESESATYLKPCADRLRHQRAPLGIRIHAGRKVLVGIQHRALVPLADTDVIGGGQIEIAIGRDPYPWRRIVHDRGAILRAGREVVLEAKRVPDLVRR